MNRLVIIEFKAAFNHHKNMSSSIRSILSFFGLHFGCFSQVQSVQEKQYKAGSTQFLLQTWMLYCDVCQKEHIYKKKKWVNGNFYSRRHGVLDGKLVPRGKEGFMWIDSKGYSFCIESSLDMDVNITNRDDLETYLDAQKIPEFM